MDRLTKYGRISEKRDILRVKQKSEMLSGEAYHITDSTNPIIKLSLVKATMRSYTASPSKMPNLRLCITYQLRPTYFKSSIFFLLRPVTR